MKEISLFRPFIGGIIFLIILFSGCRRNEIAIDKLNPPIISNTDSVQVIINGSPPEFKTRIYIFDEETVNQIVSYSPNRIVIKKGAILRGGKAINVIATDIKEGEVLAAGKTSKTPLGFNRKITGVTESKNGTELEIDTKNATLEDIFSNASFTIKKSFEHNASLNYTLSSSSGSNGSGLAAELKTSGSVVKIIVY